MIQLLESLPNELIEIIFAMLAPRVVQKLGGYAPLKELVLQRCLKNIFLADRLPIDKACISQEQMILTPQKIVASQIIMLENISRKCSLQFETIDALLKLRSEVPGFVEALGSVFQMHPYNVDDLHFLVDLSNISILSVNCKNTEVTKFPPQIRKLELVEAVIRSPLPKQLINLILVDSLLLDWNFLPEGLTRMVYSQRAPRDLGYFPNNLKKLVLEGWRNLNNRRMNLTNLTQLESFELSVICGEFDLPKNLRSIDISGGSMEYLVRASEFPYLKNLRLGECLAMTVDELKSPLPESLESLTVDDLDIMTWQANAKVVFTMTLPNHLKYLAVQVRPEINAYLDTRTVFPEGLATLELFDLKVYLENNGTYGDLNEVKFPRKLKVLVLKIAELKIPDKFFNNVPNLVEFAAIECGLENIDISYTKIKRLTLVQNDSNEPSHLKLPTSLKEIVLEPFDDKLKVHGVKVKPFGSGSVHNVFY